MGYISVSKKGEGQEERWEYLRKQDSIKSDPDLSSEGNVLFMGPTYKFKQEQTKAI